MVRPIVYHNRFANSVLESLAFDEYKSLLILIFRKHHVRRIHQRWRSQRRSYTWAAYNELMCLLRLEQPRIVPPVKGAL